MCDTTKCDYVFLFISHFDHLFFFFSSSHEWFFSVSCCFTADTVSAHGRFWTIAWNSFLFLSSVVFIVQTQNYVNKQILFWWKIMSTDRHTSVNTEHGGVGDGSEESGFVCLGHCAETMTEFERVNKISKFKFKYMNSVIVADPMENEWRTAPR